MKTIKVTHIDTGGHGYMSVSKKDFLEVCTPLQITGYSGHNLTRMYLEEDQDASTFMDAAEQQGYKVEVKSSYNLKFNCTHNYKPNLFAYKPIVGQEIELSGNGWFKVTEVEEKRILVQGQGKRYQIMLPKLFEYIIDAR